METETSLADRVKLARKTRGLSQLDLAKRLNTGQSTIASIESGRNRGSSYLIHIAKALGVDAGWLATGQGSMDIGPWAKVKDQQLRDLGHNPRELPVDIGEQLSRLDEPESAPGPQQTGIVVWDRPEDLPEDTNRVWIDRFDLACSAGNGVAQWEVRQKSALPFMRDFFFSIGSRPEVCKLVTVRGDSMEPFLFDKDMIMVDTSRITPRDGGVYAVCFEEEFLVKQVFKQAGGALTLHSYNPKYPDRTVPANEHTRFEILGQVVYRSGSGLPSL